MKIILPDNSVKELKDGATALEAAQSISVSLAAQAFRSERKAAG